jgi:DNA primase large subunit
LADVDSRSLAAFPFLREASRFVKERGPSLEELLRDMAYSGARGAGVQRVRSALELGRIDPPACRLDHECLAEMLSYICARFVVSVAGSPALTRRYALMEAERAKELLRREPADVVASVCEELGLPVEQEEERFRVHFTLYLKYAVPNQAEWKLINRRVDRGMVVLDRDTLCRLAQNVLRARFESELPLDVPDPVKEVFAEDARALKNEADARLRQFQPKDLGKIRIMAFPPCMRHLLAMAQAGENVPHTGRFAIVAFLHSLGVSSEEIMKAFAGSPDFQEEKTRYQVEHITGVTSGTEYSAPGCDTMRTYGICFEPDFLCRKEWLSHPMKYYKVKIKPRKETGKPGNRGAGEPATNGRTA